MSRAFLLALLVVGCGRQLNPEFCADNPNDVECRAADLVMVDAPAGCPTMACKDMTKPVCEESAHNCVECIPTGVPGHDAAQCPADETCGEDRTCHACIVDTDCKDSKVCLSDGTCAALGNVLYAAPAPAGMGTLCTIDMPCTFTTAVSLLGTRTIVKLTTTKGTDYSEPPIVVGKSGTIIGTGATFTPSGPGPAIAMDKQTNVEIVGLTIQSATAQGILCNETKLQLRRATIIGSGDYGVKTTKCEATIERTKLMRNVAGAMSLADATFEVRNNIVGPDNGSTSLTQGNIHTDKAKGRIVFNTVAKNKSENGGGDRFGAIKCAGSPELLVAHNIFTSNGSANAEIGGDCNYFSNYVGDDFIDLHFAGTTDFHLTMMSPTSNPLIRDDPDADRAQAPAYDCRLPGATDASPYLDDFDGQARPYLLCDRGADEWRP